MHATNLIKPHGCLSSTLPKSINEGNKHPFKYARSISKAMRSKVLQLGWWSVQQNHILWLYDGQKGALRGCITSFGAFRNLEKALGSGGGVILTIFYKILNFGSTIMFLNCWETPSQHQDIVFPKFWAFLRSLEKTPKCVGGVISEGFFFQENSQIWNQQ